MKCIWTLVFEFVSRECVSTFRNFRYGYPWYEMLLIFFCLLHPFSRTRTKETENMHDSYPSPHAAPHHASRHAAPQQASRHAAPQQASRYAAPQQASRHAAPQQASRHASPPRGYTNSAYYSPHAQHYASGYATPSRGNMYGSSYPSPYAAPHYASHGAPHPNYEMQVQFRYDALRYRLLPVVVIT